MKKYDKTWWLLWFKYAAIRALKTVAQCIVGLIPAAVTIADVDWVAVIGSALLAGVISMLTSLAGLPELDPPKEEKSEDQK